jgi:hypothetical protein
MEKISSAVFDTGIYSTGLHRVPQFLITKPE